MYPLLLCQTAVGPTWRRWNGSVVDLPVERVQVWHLSAGAPPVLRVGRRMTAAERPALRSSRAWCVVGVAPVGGVHRRRYLTERVAFEMAAPGGKGSRYTGRRLL